MSCLRARVARIAICAPLSVFACDAGDQDGGADQADGDTSDDVNPETETGGEQGEPDTDQDGLTDAEEAEIGTDPLDPDTDDDTYLDGWEVTELTDPLDPESRIYFGYWPYNPDKESLEHGDWDTASRMPGSLFPREMWLDQFGEGVDLYDFANFTQNPTGEPAYLIIDISAQWCGPCHNVADWIAGVDSESTAWVQDTYPTVREKVHDHRIFWVTYVVQNSAGGAPTLSDAESWAAAHQDPDIPVFVDETQEVQARYASGSFPHFFLLQNELRMELWMGGSTDPEDPYPIIGIVDLYL